MLPVLLLLTGLQGCATSSKPPTLVAQPAPDPVTAAAPGSQAELKGDLVPAVIGIPADPGPERTYRIGPYDLLKIEVFQVQELSRQERVNDEGFVTLPLIGPVQVAGLTPREAEQAIAAKLGEEYLQNPQVNIFVAEYASQKVTVTGRVKKPGVFPVAGKTTLMQAIALAGGLDDVAKKEEVVVFRRQPAGDVSAYVVDLAAIEEGKLTDPVIVGDDRIVVPKSGAAVFSRALGNILQGWVIRAPVY
ncbi:MAG: polysaccharide biosynthesis/export family protein [Bdellovibrio bacteriovorus]